MKSTPTCFAASSMARASLMWPGMLALGVIVVLGGIMVAYRRLRGAAPVAAGGIELPAHATPLSTVMTLRRIRTEHGAGLNDARRSELEQEIAMIELKYFGPEGQETANGELGDVLKRWAQTVQG